MAGSFNYCAPEKTISHKRIRYQDIKHHTSFIAQIIARKHGAC